jgi:hypothetical protein
MRLQGENHRGPTRLKKRFQWTERAERVSRLPRTLSHVRFARSGPTFVTAANARQPAATAIAATAVLVKTLVKNAAEAKSSLAVGIKAIVNAVRVNNFPYLTIVRSWGHTDIDSPPNRLRFFDTPSKLVH